MHPFCKVHINIHVIKLTKRIFLPSYTVCIGKGKKCMCSSSVLNRGLRISPLTILNLFTLLSSIYFPFIFHLSFFFFYIYPFFTSLLSYFFHHQMASADKGGVVVFFNIYTPSVNIIERSKRSVPDKRSRILEVVVVRRLLTWVLGIWSGEGMGKG